MMPSGVARPSAHGQAMISTATAAVNASFASPMIASQATRVIAAMAIAVGTKTAATRSASRCTSARLPWASSTSRTIWASAVSAPTRVASTTSEPLALTVAPITSSPGPTSTGTGSPVTIDASTLECPSTIIPSVAIFSPGRTTNRVPTRQLVEGHLGAVLESRRSHTEVGQRADGITGAPFGPDLQPLADQDQRHDDGGRLVVHVRAAAVGHRHRTHAVHR